MKSSRKCLRVVSELPAAAETWAEGLGASWILSRRPASPAPRLFGGERRESERHAAVPELGPQKFKLSHRLLQQGGPPGRRLLRRWPSLPSSPRISSAASPEL